MILLTYTDHNQMMDQPIPSIPLARQILLASSELLDLALLSSFTTGVGHPGQSTRLTASTHWDQMMFMHALRHIVQLMILILVWTMIILLFIVEP